MPDQTAGPVGAPDLEAAHNYGTEAHAGLEKFATALGQIGIDPAAVDAVGKMADVVQKITSGLAKGMKEQPAQPAHTMDTATEAMMADRNAAAAPPAGA